MYADIYKDHMFPVELFGWNALFTEGTVPREEVPDGWHCYDLCGTDRHPDKPLILTDLAVVYRTGAVLSPVPLKRDITPERRVDGRLFAEGRTVTLAEFCRERGLPCPRDPRKYVPRPASPEEAGLFYAMEPEEDEKQGAIGHVRMDFGYEGKEFWHTWWPRGPEELNTPEFKAELGQVVNELRRSVLKNLSSMRRYCWQHGGEINGGTCTQNYGFTVETERYLYRLRCNPIEGDYQAYLSCFDKQARKTD